MTELERATQVYCQEHNDDCADAIGDECPFIVEAFKAGAEWQKKQLIDKACEWLSDNCDAYKSVGYEDGHHVLQRVNNNVIEDFKKAMED